MDNNKYIEAIKIINTEQEKIIGETIAKIVTNEVNGLQMNSQEPTITGDPKAVLQELVNKYAVLFGQASIMVSKEALKKVHEPFSSNELPDILK